jgi:thioredoxin-like negative regulator of GroEL
VGSDASELLGAEAPGTGPTFVVFTTPTCEPCKAVLRSIDTATQGTGATRTINVRERSDLALKHGVRSVPTTMLIDGGGRVAHRWTRVPDPDDVRTALARTSSN